MNIYKLPLPAARLAAKVGRRNPKLMIAIRQWLTTRERIDWKHPRNMQQYAYCQLFTPPYQD